MEAERPSRDGPELVVDTLGETVGETFAQIRADAVAMSTNRPGDSYEGLEA